MWVKCKSPAPNECRPIPPALLGHRPCRAHLVNSKWIQTIIVAPICFHSPKGMDSRISQLSNPLSRTPAPAAARYGRRLLDRRPQAGGDRQPGHQGAGAARLRARARVSGSGRLGTPRPARSRRVKIVSLHLYSLDRHAPPVLRFVQALAAHLRQLELHWRDEAVRAKPSKDGRCRRALHRSGLSRSRRAREIKCARR